MAIPYPGVLNTCVARENEKHMKQTSVGVSTHQFEGKKHTSANTYWDVRGQAWDVRGDPWDVRDDHSFNTCQRTRVSSIFPYIVYPNFFYFLSMPYSVRYAYYHMQGSLETPTKKHVILSFQLKENTDFPSVQSSKENENIDEYCMFFFLNRMCNYLVCGDPALSLNTQNGAEQVFTPHIHYLNG